MKLGLAISQVESAERELADELERVGERHRTEHDIFQLTRTLAERERQSLERLAPHAERYDQDVDAGEDGGGLLSSVREKSAELLGRRPESGLLLLRDLRELHMLAAQASINWVLLAQGAQAAKDTELLDAVSQGHDQTLKTLKWTTYRLKEAAPQVLTS